MENSTFYGTDVDTFYVDGKGQGWLLSSADWTEDRKPEKCTVPADAVKLPLATLDWQHREDAAEIDGNLDEFRAVRE